MNKKDVLKMNEAISWIGVVDRELVTFDIVMETKYGTTYNSYFIDAEKKAIIDTVKEAFWPEYKEKILALTDPYELEYIICNHTEPDHSGALKYLLELAPNATVVGSGQALTYLNEMLGQPFKSLRVKHGDVIDLGNKKLHIIGAPNLHWPDSIYTYVEEDGVLFTCDSFGAHYATDSEKMMDDELEDYTEAFDYYFDVILKPYSKFILKAIEKIKELPIEMICPGHGPILRSTWKEKVDHSEQMALSYLVETAKDSRALVAYVSAYGYTKQMAVLVATGLKQSGISVDLVDIETMLLGDLEELVVKSDGLLIGSPTINQNTLLPVYKLFSVINPIRDKGKLGGAFGSFGWSGEAVGLIENHLKNLKIKVPFAGQTARFYPNKEESQKLIDLGVKFAEALKEEV
jgi:flavorubredoxin